MLNDVDRQVWRILLYCDAHPVCTVCTWVQRGIAPGSEIALTPGPHTYVGGTEDYTVHIDYNQGFVGQIASVAVNEESIDLGSRAVKIEAAVATVCTPSPCQNRGRSVQRGMQRSAVSSMLSGCADVYRQIGCPAIAACVRRDPPVRIANDAAPYVATASMATPRRIRRNCAPTIAGNSCVTGICVDMPNQQHRCVCPIGRGGPICERVGIDASYSAARRGHLCRADGTSTLREPR